MVGFTNQNGVKQPENGNRKQPPPPGPVALDFKTIFMENTDEFCKHSTLHGLKYVVDEHLYPMERIFFALSVVIVVLMSIFFISDVYSKWLSTPVIVAINPFPTFITNEPFPAVTLCNLNQASRKKSIKYGQNSSEYAMLQLLCHREVDMSVADSINWNLFEDFIVNISQPCKDMIKGCRYGAVDYKCSDIFRTTITDEGLCCTFNMINPSFMYVTKVSKLRSKSYTDGAAPIKWDPEHGYPAKLPAKFYPRTAAGTGETLGLSLTLDVEVGDYYCSSATSIGVKMALHSPTETPHVREIGTLLAAGMETKIRIRPDKIEAARNLKSIDKIYRQCLFEGEAKLDYFAYYNRRNCEMECHARALLKYCDCLAHYMPMIKPKVRICGIKDTLCVEAVRQNKLIPTEHRKDDEELEDCQKTCWPSCFDLTFYSDYFSAPISHAGFAVANELVKNVSSEYAGRNMAVVHFYFKENTFRSTKLTEFVGITDFLSSIGGLMGLFMGFSIISVAEFIYYAVLRPYHVIKRHERVHFHEHGSALSNLPSANVGGHYITPSWHAQQVLQSRQMRQPIETVRPNPKQAGQTKPFKFNTQSTKLQQFPAMNQQRSVLKLKRRLSDHFGQFVKHKKDNGF